MYSQDNCEGLGVTSSGKARLAEQKGQGKHQQKGAAVEAGKHKSQPGTAKQAVLKDTTNAPQCTQAEGINKAGVQLETKTDAADKKVLFCHVNKTQFWKFQYCVLRFAHKHFRPLN
ncbi:TPA: hypothetical protein ACH3X2_006311 [Trebouxia sp. C0005]